MSYTSKLLCPLILSLASCASAGPEGGSAASTVSAEMTLFTLSREGVPPAASVFLTEGGAWGLISHDACRGVTGLLPGDKTAELQDLLADPGMHKAASSCASTSFKLTILDFGKTRSLCWDEGARPSNHAIDAFSAFFDARVQDLKWDGKKVEPCNGMPLTIQDMHHEVSPENQPAPMVPPKS